MTWQKNKKDSAINQQYYLQNGKLTIAKVTVKDKTIYELFNDKKYVKSFDSFADASTYAEG